MEATSPATMFPTPLVGRDRELAILRERLRTALIGQGGVVLIGGMAGIGKTALADELCRGAAEAGARVLAGHCYDRAETSPYGPWIQSFTRFGAGGPTTDLRGAVPPSVVDVSSQEAFFWNARAFFAVIAAERPLVLVLEDFHWADAASLDLLRFLARETATLALLLVVTYREEELGRRHPLAALLPLLVREAPTERIELRPLDAAAARALVRARYDLPEDEAGDLAAYLLERTEGNPLFMTELLRALQEERLLHRDAGRWRVEAIGHVPVPRLLRQIVDDRLVRLGDAADAMLAVAAVIGHEVPLAVWAAVTQVGEETLGAIAEMAEAAHLVTAWPGGAGIRFAHALIREALYESIPALRRRRLHRQVGEALVAAGEQDPDAVAYHFQQAGDDRAVAWLVRAAERAQDAYAIAAAGDRYEATFRLLDARSGEASGRGWLRLLATVVRHYHSPVPARDWVDEAVRLADEAGDASLAARALALRGLLRGYREEFRDGVADLAAGVEAAERLPPGVGVLQHREEQVDRIVNRGTLIAFLAHLGHLGEARAQGERFLAGAAAHPPALAAVGARADVYHALAMLYALQGEAALSRRSYPAAVAAYEQIGHHLFAFILQREELALLTLPYLADDLALRARFADAAERASRRLDAASRRGAIDTRPARLPLLVLEGHWREARRAAEDDDAWTIVGEVHLRNSVLEPLARAQGDPRRAWQCVREAWPDGPATELGERFVPYTVPLLLLGASLALDEGDLATARTWLDAHARWMQWMGATLGRAEGQLLEAEWQRAAGDTARVRAHAMMALRHATAPRQPLALMASHRLLGVLDGQAGDPARAERQFAEALALADACRVPYERALTLLARAELAATLGDDSAAVETALDEARAICVPMEARLALAWAERIAALPSRAAAPSPLTANLPAGLSAREAEVLRLVAQGLDNAAIAQRLFISRHTVKAHVANIFGKLGVTNRAAATRFALERGLA